MKISLEMMVATLGEIELEYRAEGQPRAATVAAAKRTLADLLADQVVERQRLKSAARLAKVLAEQPSPAGMD